MAVLESGFLFTAVIDTIPGGLGSSFNQLRHNLVYSLLIDIRDGDIGALVGEGVGQRPAYTRTPAGYNNVLAAKTSNTHIPFLRILFGCSPGT